MKEEDAKNHTSVCMAIMQAFLDGETIEVRNKGDNLWMEAIPDKMPEWNFSKYVYRVKPEPFECFINVYHHGGFVAFRTAEEAQAVAAQNPSCRRIAMKVREVEDEG